MDRRLYFVGYMVINLILISCIIYYAEDLRTNPCDNCEKIGYECHQKIVTTMGTQTYYGFNMSLEELNDVIEIQEVQNGK